MTHQVQSQEDTFALLSDPRTHAGRSVRRIDTHAAVVFLAGDRALKIKRAVRFPFLDFSTPERRKLACESEIEVNRPFAPGVYRRVVPITRARDGRLALDGDGEPVDWAVEMQRFDENLTLDLLAERGKIDLELADAVARAVAAAHARAPIASAEQWIEALSGFIDQNEAEFRENPDLFPTDQTGALSNASRAALARLRPLLRQRGEIGLVRRGHGDLHLGNIALIDGTPVPFDAIEFDPLFAIGDVLYDLAFLLMDLVERKLDAAANVVLNRYLAETGRPEDLDALAALPLFLSMRASVRAKVTAAQREFSDVAERGRLAEAARTYFRLALALIAPPAPLLIAVGGLSGTGKSVLARALAPRIPPAPGAVVLRSDVQRKAIFGAPETARLPAEAYAPEVTTRVYANLCGNARRIVAAGHSVIVDAVFARPTEREQIAAMAHAGKVAFRGLFLTADLATRVARVGARASDASDADADVARAQERYELGTLDWARVDASGAPEDTLSAALAGIGDNRDGSHALGSRASEQSAGCVRTVPRA